MSKHTVYFLIKNGDLFKKEVEVEVVWIDLFSLTFF